MQNKKSLRLFGQRLFLTSAFCLVLTGPGWAQAQGFGDLNDVILTVQSMVMGGQPRADVAAFVTRIVADRITSLNYWTPSRDGQPLASAELQALRTRFQAWSDAGVNVDQPFAAADWAWKNRAGHCAENAHTAFHILVMALRSTENLSEVKCGDHQYIIWGDVQRLRTDCSVTDLQNLDNTYIVDPWGNFCCSTRILPGTTTIGPNSASSPFPSFRNTTSINTSGSSSNGSQIATATPWLIEPGCWGQMLLGVTRKSKASGAVMMAMRSSSAGEAGWLPGTSSR